MAEVYFFTDTPLFSFRCFYLLTYVGRTDYICQQISLHMSFILLTYVGKGNHQETKITT